MATKRSLVGMLAGVTMVALVGLAGCKTTDGASPPRSSPPPAHKTTEAAAGDNGATHQQPGQQAQPPAKVVSSWKGRVLVSAAEPGGAPPDRMPPLVIRDQKAYDAFVAMIPKNKITKTSPAPPSDDPLLNKPPMDFSKHALVVGLRADSMYVHPEVAAVEQKDGALHVTMVLPPPGDTAMYAARTDVGTYRAVLVHAPGDTRVEVKLVDSMKTK